MKKAITAITALIILASGYAKADPSIIMNIGVWPEENNSKAEDKPVPLSVIFKTGVEPGFSSSKGTDPTYGFIFSVESLITKNHAFSPYFASVDNSYGKNTGFGIDYVYKLVNTKKHALKLAIGAIKFRSDLNDGEKENIHIGVGFEINTSKSSAFVISFDHFSNGRNILNREDTVSKNIPVNMFSLGYRFK